MHAKIGADRIPHCDGFALNRGTVAVGEELHLCVEQAYHLLYLIVRNWRIHLSRCDREMIGMSHTLNSRFILNLCHAATNVTQTVTDWCLDPGPWLPTAL